MNLFRTLPNQDFIANLADFILEFFPINLDNLKVIVPSGNIAYNLQKKIIEKKSNSILPEIFNYEKIISSGEEVFKIPSDSIEIISSLEERIMIVEIIKSYKKLKYNNLQALNFSPHLAKLFNQIILNKIKIEDISNLSTISKAEHWKVIYEFLQYSFTQWQKNLRLLKKISKAEYLIEMLKLEHNRLKNEKYYTIVAGMYGYDYTAWQFLKLIASSKNGYIFLPPLPVNYEPLNLTRNNLEIDNFYCLTKFLSIINKDLEDFKIYGPIDNSERQILDNIILPNKTINTDIVEFAYEERGAKPMSTGLARSDNVGKFKFVDHTDNICKNIHYIECNDIFSEAEVISNICQSNIDKKIAIILVNNKPKNYYELSLKKNNLNFNNQLGQDIFESHISQLIIYLGELVCNDFILKNLFIFFKNPLIFSAGVIKLEQLLILKNRFPINIDQVNDVVTNSNNLELIEWWNNKFAELSKLFYLLQNNNHSDFEFILKNIILTLENLLPNIWENEFCYAFEISTFITEIFESDIKPTCSINSEFPIIFKTILKSAKKYEVDNNNHNIYICSPKDAALIKFDIVILADFSEGNWPPAEDINPWLNRQMQQQLEFYPEDIKNSTHLYNFYLLLHQEQVYITRSMRQGTTILQTSNYIRMLKFILPINHHLSPRAPASIITGPSTPTLKAPTPSLAKFPTRISATDIEMLVRNPYSFYAKKILKLRKIPSLNEPAGLLEYGNYIHSLFDNYAKIYFSADINKIHTFLELAKKTLFDLPLPQNIKHSWLLKTNALANEYVYFDESRRKNNVIYTEVSGLIKLDVFDHQIEVFGRADRIEIGDNGNCTIIDFKTGDLPNVAEVSSGLSPQLIILSLIALDKGFKLDIKNIANLMYVKIGSSKPYIKTLEIKITNEDLLRHKNAIINLLNHYIKTMDFNIDIDLLNYNDYKHFARNFS